MLTNISTGLRNALIADATILAAVGQRVYFKRAAESATLPYLLINDAGGGSTNETQLDAFDMFWQVDCISDNGQTVPALGARVRSVLHNSRTVAPVTPWKLLDIQHESSIFFVEEVERRQYYHAAETFRVRGTL